MLFLPAGERHKRLATVESLAQQLALAGADRDSILLAFGGGVIGDVTGFLAAIYMRGIRYVGLPTTLLAQVDSSLGGKTGVNLLAGKNLIGAFHHPLAVFSDIDLLRTLPPAELRAGLQEAIKSAIIRDPSLFRFMEKNADAILSGDPAALQKVVTASVRVKAEVVSQDEKESGLRMVLNFGHTIGHAIEAATHYRKLLHGEAVAWGSIAALHLSLNRGSHHPGGVRPHGQPHPALRPHPAVQGRRHASSLRRQARRPHLRRQEEAQWPPRLRPRHRHRPHRSRLRRHRRRTPRRHPRHAHTMQQM